MAMIHRASEPADVSAILATAPDWLASVWPPPLLSPLRPSTAIGTASSPTTR